MSIARQIYQSVMPLPEPLAREVLDFIAFLKLRQSHRESDDLQRAQTQSQALADWENADDEVWNDVSAV
jgi:hypothetical protein